MQKKNILQKFLIQYLLFSILIAGIAVSLPILFPSTKLLTGNFWIIYAFFWLVTLLAYTVAFLGAKRQTEGGIMAIMLSITIKLLFSMAFVLIYSMKSAEKGPIFIGNFFSLYLLFSFFEIYSLLRNLRHQNK